MQLNQQYYLHLSILRSLTFFLVAFIPLIIINITNATITKSMILVIKSPYKTATSEILLEVSASLAIHFRSLKSALKANPISGETIPPVNVLNTRS